MEDPAKNHPVHAALQQLKSLRSSAALNDLNDELDETRRRSLDRVFYVVEAASKGVRRARGIRANLSTLTNISNSLQSVRQELENYTANRNVGHIDNALSHADTSLAIFVEQLPPVSVSEETEAAIESFRSNSRSAIGELKANEGILRKRIEELKTELAAHEARLAGTQTDLSDVRGAIEATIGSAQERFDAYRSALEGEFVSLKEAQKTALENELVSNTKLADQVLSDLRKQEEAAKSLVQSVGHILTTASYSATAADESKAANLYRYVTIALFAVGIAIILSNYWIHWISEAPAEDTPWLVIARFATALAIALPAFYTARESARHRTNADRARQRELELTTLGPFIELLPNDKKVEIRDRLTDRYFGGEIEKHEIQTPLNVEQLTKLAEVFSKWRPTP